MEIWSKDAPKQRRLRLNKGMSDALADYARRRWPQGAAKAAEREWSLTRDEARNLVAGRASKTTIEKAFTRGGLFVAIPVIEEVVGETVSQIIRELRKQHDENGRRIAALDGAWLPVAAHGRPTPSDDDAAGPGRPFAPRRRGAVGSDR